MREAGVSIPGQKLSRSTMLRSLARLEPEDMLGVHGVKAGRLGGGQSWRPPGLLNNLDASRNS